MSKLSPQELARYSRHILLPEVQVAGQQKLKDSSVLLIGAGGLGAPMALYLAAAGVGRIGIVDFDVVDESNLQRQIIHGTSTVGQPKLQSAMTRLKDLNPHIIIEGYETRLSSENAIELFKKYDVVADGTDNFPTRFLVNDACVLTGKPNVYASIFRFEGQVTVFNYQGGPCYRCLYSEPPPPGLVPSCAEGGVLGILPGVVGSLQATEVVKVLLGLGESMSGRLLIYDALRLKFRELKVRRDPDCPVCGKNPTVTALIDYEQFCGIPAKEETPTMNDHEIDVHGLKQLIDSKANFTLIDVREPWEYDTCKIAGSKLIPLGTLSKAISDLDKSAHYVMQCKSGGRSGKATDYLLGQGFKNVKNLVGGILAWIEEIDPSQQAY
jgi:molybdopterin/thiamine biosynthesis adenylyltransferase/rhodanese-related sulfurtransferase